MESFCKIIYRDAEVLAVDKPAGLSVHNDAENLLSLLAREHGELFPVHRLDKETSGVQILARHANAARDWAESFQAREGLKLYLGVARGSFASERGTWDKPVSDKGESRRAPAGTERKPARTDFAVLARSKHLSFLEFVLHTGRQHQIRKHAALAGHPLLGDDRYGDPKYNAKLAAHLGARMFLHCARLEMRGHVFVAEDPGFRAKVEAAP